MIRPWPPLPEGAPTAAALLDEVWKWHRVACHRRVRSSPKHLQAAQTKRAEAWDAYHAHLFRYGYPRQAA